LEGEDEAKEKKKRKKKDWNFDEVLTKKKTKKKNGVILNVSWHRVILDEGLLLFKRSSTVT